MSWIDWISDFAGAARVGATVYQAYSAYGDARASQIRSDAQRTANEAKALQAENAARIALWQRQDVLDAGQVTEGKIRVKGAQTKGAQIAAMAANGVDVNFGSALRAITDTDVLAEQDVIAARTNTANQAWTLENQSIQSTNQAALARAGYVNPGTNENEAIIGAVLSGGASLAKEWFPRVSTVLRN